MRKNIVAAALCAALLAGLLAAPASAAAFPDVDDPQVQEAAQVLGQLNIVNGKPGGLFDPQGVFTRAEFCKMALTALGRAEEQQRYADRVIFPDVTATHWALGYVNAAAAVEEGSTPLVRGRGDGRFCPNDPISWGEAVTILMRCLGYTDKDIGSSGGTWYDGAMLRARSTGLLDGLGKLDGGFAITRAQAALLFENLLYTPAKGGTDPFLSTALDGAVSDSQLVLETKGKALPAGGWAVKTDKGSFVTLRGDLPAALQGRMCQLVTDKDQNVLALRADRDYTTRALRIASAEARYVVTDGDEHVLVPGATHVWRAGSDEGSYSAAYKTIPAGTAAVLCYDKTETLVSLYLTGDSASAVTAVAKEGAVRPFEGAWEAQPTAVYKNGAPASLSDVRPYDVGTFDPGTGVLELCDRKLTGVFEDAAPSPVSPSSITVMGCSFPVLDCALEDLARFRLEDRMTLLLDSHNRVAGVVSPSKASGVTLGTASVVQDGVDERDKPIYMATVSLPWGPTLKGRVRRISLDGIAAAPGRLYAVSSTDAGELVLSTASSDAVPGDWDVKAGAVGPVKVSPRAAVYDRVENGPLVHVGLEAVTCTTVPARNISFLHLDANHQIDLLVLKDVTGDAYTYGRLSFQAGSNSSGMADSVAPTTTVTNGKTALDLITSSTYSTLKNGFMGLAPSLSTLDGKARLGGSATLTRVQGVPRTAFDQETVTVNGTVFPLAAVIDQCCYNAAGESWFDSLDDALAYASSLTVYYDKSPQEGGKVRLVTTEQK